ncbi:hypothetical protein NQ176_g5957 [Zarea fungicola]|uniref:Uncharacterized protein n=1 Tax=Zarea fungicola TaxID=93591 RepID=A0ACC1N806_9HYPO|nr:hypothetical protein NQ176_g5957 [Lecanicillium fungicola]
MARCSGVGSNLCALLLHAGEGADAVELLERGRAVIIGNFVRNQDRLARLRKINLPLAQRFEHLQAQINAPDTGEKNGAEWLARCLGRDQAIAKLTVCIEEIQQLPQHEQFMEGITVTEMQRSAVDGTIIIVNINAYMSHAVLISQDSFESIRLEQVMFADVKKWKQKSWTNIQFQDRWKKNLEYAEYLSWLWESCVEQIMKALPQKAAKQRARVWWIGVGEGNTMPFHAAGNHSPGSTENVISKVVSSYASSVASLRYAQDCAESARQKSGSLLTVTMQTTPTADGAYDARLGNLPGVIEEEMVIQNEARGIINLQSLNQPTVEDVLAALQVAKIAHFACHGITDGMDPSNSALVLEKSAAKRLVQDRLTVYKISELKLANTYIAYLSACSTAGHRVPWLSEEVISVVSGFQISGFPHVIGSLWQTVDSICLKVAARFYRKLLRSCGTEWSNFDIALALHEAVLVVREKELDMPLKWAPFVHFGA